MTDIGIYYFSIKIITWKANPYSPLGIEIATFKNVIFHVLSKIYFEVFPPKFHKEFQVFF
jgi:hypothetical protein